MAHGTVSLHSDQIGRNVNIRFFLPIETCTAMPALVLLHGLGGNEQDWLLNTQVALFARERGLAVFCPAGENSFYTSRSNESPDFDRFVGEELPGLLRRLFPISQDAEHLYIGGMSMGGFGALNIGYRYPQVYSKVIALSSALWPWELPMAQIADSCLKQAFFDAAFSDRGHCDTLLLAKECGKNAPDIYLACGADDAFLKAHVRFLAELRANHLPVPTAVTEPGGHDWHYWNRAIASALLWLTEGQNG